MSRMAELAAELPPEDGNTALHFDLVAALTRVAAGTSIPPATTPMPGTMASSSTTVVYMKNSPVRASGWRK